MDPAERLRLNEALSRLADGDREAFHPAFVCLRPLLLRFAARHLPADEAEDVAQEALLRVFFRASEFDRTRDAGALRQYAAGLRPWGVAAPTFRKCVERGLSRLRQVWKGRHGAP